MPAGAALRRGRPLAGGGGRDGGRAGRRAHGPHGVGTGPGRHAFRAGPRGAGATLRGAGANP